MGKTIKFYKCNLVLILQDTGTLRIWIVHSYLKSLLLIIFFDESVSSHNKCSFLQVAPWGRFKLQILKATNLSNAFSKSPQLWRSASFLSNNLIRINPQFTNISMVVQMMTMVNIRSSKHQYVSNVNFDEVKFTLKQPCNYIHRSLKLF